MVRRQLRHGTGATFAIPITFNDYSPGVNNTAGALLATRTQTFDVPFRPSSDNVNCTGGRWFDGARGCFNGLATNVTFDFASQHAQLPSAWRRLLHELRRLPLRLAQHRAGTQRGGRFEALPGHALPERRLRR